MMETLYWIIGATLVMSVGSLALAASLFLLPHKIQHKLIPNLVSYAVGALLTGALVGLLPEALHHFEEINVGHHLPWMVLLIGILGFFVLEKVVRVHHCHNNSCKSHGSESASMILIGDAMHNFVDGVLIAASFSVSIEVGIIATASIFIHEVAQEIGDFGILLHSGYSRKKAFLANLFSSLTALVGALLGFWWIDSVEPALPYIMMVAAASFIYIALADLSPELHKTTTFKHSVKQLCLVLLGVGTILLISLLHTH